MNYPDSVRFLYALGNEIKTAKFGLERISQLMDALNGPQRRPHRFIHVAGTNGKGSVCATLESGLRAAGLRTGLFTSPHLLEPTERIRIDGEPVSRDEFTAAFEEVHQVSERLLLDGRIDLHPTYFETVTAMAFLVFRARDVGIAVLETGLGGRLDATNVAEPELCVITPVDFDHEKFLGNTIESIAVEKAGILKPAVPLVLSPQRKPADEVIRARARDLHVPVIDAWQAASVDASRTGNRIYAHGLTISSPLAGHHQLGNVLTAATALHALSISRESIETGVRCTQWSGRLQRLKADPDIIVDGAHNPAGARALADYVTEFYPDPKPILIFGAMRDKAVGEMADLLFPSFQAVVVTAPKQDRALAPEAFLALTDHPRVRTAPDLSSALAGVMEAGSAIFIAGSLFLVAEALELVPYVHSPRTRSS